MRIVEQLKKMTKVWHPIARDSSAAARGVGTLADQQERALRLADHYSNAVKDGAEGGDGMARREMDARRAARWAEKFQRKCM